MAGSSGGLHEAAEQLSAETIERHRAIASLMEELEAVDWYDQRVEATSDPALRRILAHNRDEEKEHAAMALEWLRRRDQAWDAMLRTYLFTEGEITAIEEAAEAGEAGQSGEAGAAGAGEGGEERGGDGSLGIGSLKGRS